MTSPHTSRIALCTSVFLFLCLFALLMSHARSASITFDEGPHLAIGYATLRTGDLRLQPIHIHPPLANVMAAAPLLLQRDLPDPRAVDGWDIASLSAITDAVVWQYPHPQRLALAGRVPIILMTMLLGAVVFRWARDLSGLRGGLLALALYAFDSNIIAHGSLITTDMPVALWGALALFLTTRYLRRGGRLAWAGSAAALGLALASKVSALSLLPVLGLSWLIGPSALPRRRIMRAAGGLALTALILWAAYGFELRPLEGFPFPIPAATHIAIYRSLQQHYTLGHPAFLLGQNSDRGWWTYFPVAFALKTPLPTLFLLAAALVVRGQQIRESVRDKSADLRSAIHRWGPLAAFVVIYVGSSFLSSVNIGYRHLLPILPCLYVFISRLAPHASRITPHASRITPHVSRLTHHASRLTLCLLLAWLAVGALRVAPNFLAYFNELAGGPAGGYRALVDSNLDWGQNLWQLRDWMEANGVGRVYYAHFSPARPEVYGVQADFLPPDPRATPFAPLDPAPGVYVIGATVLQGVYTPDVNTYAWFRAHEPAARLGYALFVYRVPPRPAPAWAAVCADPLPALAPEAARASLGHPDLRVVLFDCAQAWAYPSGNGPGVMILSPGAQPPPGATFEAEGRAASGEPLYTVRRVEAAPAPDESASASIEGPLAFLGYRVRGYGFYPGDTIEVWTFWQVCDAPGRLLSLMGHLVSEDGALVSVSDGMGLPIEQWQPGDLIIQRHAFPVSEETPPGRYAIYTGAYWLDTMERWSVRLADGATSDQVRLQEIVVLR